MKLHLMFFLSLVLSLTSCGMLVKELTMSSEGYNTYLVELKPDVTTAQMKEKYADWDMRKFIVFSRTDNVWSVDAKKETGLTPDQMVRKMLSDGLVKEASLVADALLDLYLEAAPNKGDQKKGCYVINFPIEATTKNADGMSKPKSIRTLEELKKCVFDFERKYELVYPVSVVRHADNRTITLNKYEDMSKLLDDC
ncbi:MAG: hypothetical protein AAF738_04530 [Bacteroidota bacterium]